MVWISQPCWQKQEYYSPGKKQLPGIICISHKYRKFINSICWKASVIGETLPVPFPAEIIQHIYKNMPLIGACTDKGIVNGGFYKIITWNEEIITIQDIETGEILHITMDLLTNCRIGFALTYHQCQGRTLKYMTRLHEVNHPAFTPTHLALGISRVISPSYLDIA